MTPTVWFNKTFSPTRHQVRALQGHAHVIASHTSSDSPVLIDAHESFLEPRGLTGDAYVQYCLRVCFERRVNVFIAGKELQTLSAHKDAFEAAGTRLIVAADPDTLDLLDDKARFTAQFPTHVCAVPETRAVTTWPQFQAAVHDLRARHASVCFKPARGIYGHGFRILTDREDLGSFLAGDALHMTFERARAMLEPHATFPTLLVMQCLPGPERSVDCVAWNGELAGAVVRRKIGGLGNVQLLEDHPGILQAVRELTAHYRLSGVFNAQFKEDTAGVPHLLEINARASGGLRFSMASGLNYPLVAVRLAMGEQRASDTPAPRLGLRVQEVKDVVVLDPQRYETAGVIA